MTNLPEHVQKKHDKFIANAEEAEHWAEQSRDPVVRDSWTNIATSYRTLAKELIEGRR